MKILLDESLPKRLKAEFSQYEVLTPFEMGWQEKRKKELLALMTAFDFDVFITFDKTLRNQQNFSTFPLPVLLLSAPGNDLRSLIPLVPIVIERLERGHLQPGVTVVQKD